MAIKRVVTTDFWNDETVKEEYSAEDRYFMLYLLTNPQTKQCGIYNFQIKETARTMGYSTESIVVLLDRFENKYKNIIYNKETRELAILNFLKHSIMKGGKPVEDCLKKELTQVIDTKLIVAVYNHMLPFMEKQIKIQQELYNNNNSMYVGIKNVFSNYINLYINDNNNDNENERLVDESCEDINNIPLEVKEETTKTEVITIQISNLLQTIKKIYDTTELDYNSKFHKTATAKKIKVILNSNTKEKRLYPLQIIYAYKLYIAEQVEKETETTFIKGSEVFLTDSVYDYAERCKDVFQSEMVKKYGDKWEKIKFEYVD